jgi:hypothetical protein
LKLDYNPILQEKNTCACNYHVNMVEGWLQQHLKQSKIYVKIITLYSKV